MVDLTPAGAAQPSRARRGLSARARAGRAGELLQGVDAGGASRAGDAADGAGARRPAERRRGAPSRRTERRASPTSASCSSIEPHPRSAVLIRRGRRVADYLQADCFAVYVERTPGRERAWTPTRASASSACSTSPAGCASKRASCRATTSPTPSSASHDATAPARSSCSGTAPAVSRRFGGAAWSSASWRWRRTCR